MKKILIAGALLAVILAGVVSLFASPSPDGLERVATDHGMTSAQRPGAGSPLAGYSLPGMGPRAGTAAAGLLGVAVTAVAGFGLFYLIRGKRS